MIVVFAGPTLSACDLSRWPSLEFRPPAAAGDVATAVADGARHIAIIDGFFETTRAVWHKEIVWAMERGARVYGASSMGALRAAELHALGMEGVGRIFADYRDLVHEDDDEVALIHGPAEAGYMPLSEAMVNIRHACELALTAGRLTSEEASVIVATAKSLDYKERTCEAVVAALEGAGNEGNDLGQRFAAWWSGGDFDLKRKDGIALLDRLSACAAGATTDGGNDPGDGIARAARPPVPLTAQFVGLLAERGITP
ncbi:MAG: tfuA protein [Rhizobiales bacterium]|nr:tfuA protein [Hyphomicrobiales bacterium]